MLGLAPRERRRSYNALSLKSTARINGAMVVPVASPLASAPCSSRT